MDMETDSDEEEDGQISKLEEQEERERKLYGTTEPVVDETITLEDLRKCQINRDQLAKHYMTPWFEEFIKGRGESLSLDISYIMLRHMGPILHWSRPRGVRLSHLRNHWYALIFVDLTLGSTSPKRSTPPRTTRLTTKL